MSWSYVGKVSGSSAVTFTPGSWPAGIQDGDLVVFCGMPAPDTLGTYEFTCNTPGWTQNSITKPARFMWARYSATLALPTLTQGSASATFTWNMLAYRSTRPHGIGAHYHQDGTPPAATDITTLADNTLLVVFAQVPGDEGVGWTVSGSFTARVNQNGSGTGNPNYPNIYIGDREVASPTALTGLRVYMTANRYFILTAAESGDVLSFFTD